MSRTPQTTGSATRSSRRMLATLAALVATTATTLVAPAVTHAQSGSATTTTVPATPAPARTGYVQANGIRYYYEIHGQGEPLLLLHGGLGSISMFGPVLPELARGRQVIAVDLHGHGRTTLGDREISMVDIGGDLAIVLRELGLTQVDVMGYSFGGGVAFQLAAQHPQMVRRLVIVSAGFSRDGYHPEMLPMQAQVGAAMADMMKETPMYQSYVAVAPHPEDFPRLLDRMGELMRKPYDWSADVPKLTMPTMLVFGDSDMFRPEHVVEFYKLLGGGQRDAGWQRENMSRNRLAILPNLTHYEMFMSPALVATTLPFLNGETSAPSWAEQVSQQQ
jgi:pimeloyl-ACP methyl ester carboxylesterase